VIDVSKGSHALPADDFNVEEILTTRQNHFGYVKDSIVKEIVCLNGKDRPPFSEVTEVTGPRSIATLVLVGNPVSFNDCLCIVEIKLDILLVRNVAVTGIDVVKRISLSFAHKVAHVKDEAAKVLCKIPVPKRVRKDVSLA
jgi:hypothetical protein